MVKTDRYHSKLIRLDPELAERIVAYHHDNRIKSEAQAFRELLTPGLEAAARETEQGKV